MVLAISLITSSALLSSYRVSVTKNMSRDPRLDTLISNNNQMPSRPGEAKYSSKSSNRGIGTWGTWRVRRLFKNSQLQSIIFRSFPKHRFNVASWK